MNDLMKPKLEAKHNEASPLLMRKLEQKMPTEIPLSLHRKAMSNLGQWILKISKSYSRKIISLQVSFLATFNMLGFYRKET